MYLKKPQQQIKTDIDESVPVIEGIVEKGAEGYREERIYKEFQFQNLIKDSVMAGINQFKMTSSRLSSIDYQNRLEEISNQNTEFESEDVRNQYIGMVNKRITESEESAEASKEAWLGFRQEGQNIISEENNPVKKLGKNILFSVGEGLSNPYTVGREIAINTVTGGVGRQLQLSGKALLGWNLATQGMENVADYAIEQHMLDEPITTMGVTASAATGVIFGGAIESGKYGLKSLAYNGPAPKDMDIPNINKKIVKNEMEDSIRTGLDFDEQAVINRTTVRGEPLEPLINTMQETSKLLEDTDKKLNTLLDLDEKIKLETDPGKIADLEKQQIMLTNELQASEEALGVAQMFTRDMETAQFEVDPEKIIQQHTTERVAAKGEVEAFNLDIETDYKSMKETRISDTVLKQELGEDVNAQTFETITTSDITEELLQPETFVNKKGIAETVAPDKATENLFKLDIQTFGAGQNILKGQMEWKNLRERVFQKNYTVGKEAFNNFFGELKKNKIEMTEKTAYNLFEKNYFNKARGERAAVSNDLSSTLNIEYNGDVLNPVKFFDILEQKTGKTNVMTKFLADGKIDPDITKDFPEFATTMLDFSVKLNKYLDPLFDGNPYMDKGTALKGLSLGKEALFSKYSDGRSRMKGTSWMFGDDFYQPNISEMKAIKRRFIADHTELFVGETAREKLRSGSRVFDNLFNTQKGSYYKDNPLRATSLNKFSLLQPLRDGQFISPESLTELIKQFNVNDRLMFNKLVDAVSDSSAMYNTFGFHPDSIVKNLKKDTQFQMRGYGKESTYKIDNSFKRINTVLNAEMNRISSYDNLFNKAINSVSGIVYPAKLFGSGLAQFADIPRSQWARSTYGKNLTRVIASDLGQTINLIRGIQDIPKAEMDLVRGTATSALTELANSGNTSDIAGGYANTTSFMKNPYLYVKDQKNMAGKIKSGMAKFTGLEQFDSFVSNLSINFSMKNMSDFAKNDWMDFKTNPALNRVNTLYTQLGIKEPEFNMFKKYMGDDTYFSPDNFYDRIELDDMRQLYSDSKLPAEDLRDKFQDKWLNFLRDEIEAGKSLRPDHHMKAMKEETASQGMRAFNKLFFFMKSTAFNSLPNWYENVYTANTYLGAGGTGSMKHFNWQNKKHYGVVPFLFTAGALANATDDFIRGLMSEDKKLIDIDADGNEQVNSEELFDWIFRNGLEGLFIINPFQKTAAVSIGERMLEGDLQGALKSSGITSHKAAGLYQRVRNLAEPGRQEQRAFEKKLKEREKKLKKKIKG